MGSKHRVSNTDRCGVQNSSNRMWCIVGVVCIWSSHAMINAGEFGMWIALLGCKITNKSLKSKNRKSWYVGQQHRQPKIHVYDFTKVK